MDKLRKFFYCVGDVAYVGLGGTIIYYGVKISKWAFKEMETDLKRWNTRLTLRKLGVFLFVGDLWDTITRNQIHTIPFLAIHINVIIRSMIMHFIKKKKKRTFLYSAKIRSRYKTYILDWHRSLADWRFIFT